MRALVLLLTPSLAVADEALTLGPLTVPLPDAELTPAGHGPTWTEAKDARTGWTWRLEQVGDGAMQQYPEPRQVLSTVAQRDGLQEATELTIVPLAGGLGSLYGARSGSDSVRTCFQGRGGSLWLITMRSARSMIERSEPALRRACKEATFPGLKPLDPGLAVGIRMDPRVPVEWLPADPPGARSRAVSFHQSATGLGGLVLQQPREGHPYDTDDVSELQRAVAKDGFRVRGAEVMRAAGQDAPRLEVGRVVAGGAEQDWLMVVLRGERSIWLVQAPVRTLGYPRLKELFDLALGKAQLIED